MKEVKSCSYKDRIHLSKWDQNIEKYHQFPISVVGDGGELLSTSTSTSLRVNNNNSSSSNSNKQEYYDTLISINVLEHVQDAFQYLNGLYYSIKKGGYLILHERYYDDSTIINGDNYHPIRIKRILLDHFLSGFHIIYNNCNASYEGRLGEQGYYVVAIKI